ncbi:unnamed protein product [Rotaria sp. Silwood1]|nr:unnamed protein product [Rotaria sp. Silwood1]
MLLLYHANILPSIFSVTSTSNGELCILPYKVYNYTWDMYFCNEGYCPTQSNPNTTCTPDGTQHNIKIRKEETGSSMEIIDTVTSSPLNGWIKHQVDFTTITPGYKIYFDFEKTSGPATPMTTIAVDEISIHQGNCCTHEHTSNE